jgi:hypothetical protein
VKGLRRKTKRDRGPMPGDVILMEVRPEPGTFGKVEFRETGKVVKKARDAGRVCRQLANGQWPVLRTDGKEQKKVMVSFVASSDEATVWKEVVNG